MLSLAFSPAFSGLAFATEEEQTRESDKTQRESTADPADRDPADRVSTAEQRESDKEIDREDDERTSTPQDCTWEEDKESTWECPNRN